MNEVMTSVAAWSEIVAMERVERDAWLDMFAAAPTSLSAVAHIRSERAGACALIANQGVPISEFNRCMGLGIDTAFTQSDLDQAIRWLDSHASPNWTIQLRPQDSAGAIAEWLGDRGLERVGTGWAKFFRSLETPGVNTPQSDLDVRELSSADRAHFGAAIIGGFGFPESVGPWFASLVGRPGWRVYLAYEGDLPVACGVLYADAGSGWLGCDATLPEFRGRGAQTALIQRRIADAAAGGIEMLTAETGQPAPGQERGSRSYLNYQKAGFTKAYIRPNYRRA